MNKCIIKTNNRQIDKNASKFLAYFLPMYGILAYYPLKFSSVGMIIIYIYTIIRLMFFSKKLVINKWLICFLVYAIISQPLVFIAYGGFTSQRLVNYCMLLLITLVLAVNSNNLDLDLFFKNYRFVGIISSIAIIVQAIQIFVFNKVVTQIKILPINTEGIWYLGGVRPCGFFPEPQAFATYMIPLLIWLIKKKKVFEAIFVSFALIFSTSSLGISLVLFIWVWYLLSAEISISKKTVMILIMVFFIWGISKSSVFQYSIAKIAKIDLIDNVRLTRGFKVFLNLDTIQQTFGIGENNLGYFITHNLIMLTDNISLLMANSAYVTSTYEILIGFGIIGFLLYATMFYKMLRHDDKSWHILIIILIVLHFAQTIFYNSSFVFYLIIYYNLIDKDKNKNYLRTNN